MKKPTVFGKYLLLERINVGGMAEVFIAKAFGVEGFERVLAIKKILPAMAEDEEFITMFKDEARISVLLNHANIVHIDELGKHEENYFIAMEYVAGRDMRAILERYRKRKEIMPTAMAVFIASKMCEGLDYAHRRKDARGQDLNIIHRDISPQNILVSYEGEVKIIDFGIAYASNRSQKTQAGILKGKFGYMSPEQVRGLPIDRRSDIFAVGVILYEMLTGEKLFVGDSDFSTLEKVRNAVVEEPTKYNPNIPKGLEKVMFKALAREPEDRYQWASDLQEDLMRFLLAGDQIFSSKHLSGFMKEAFVEELAREAERMERYATLERPDQLEASDATAQPRRHTEAAPAPAARGIYVPPGPRKSSLPAPIKLGPESVVPRAGHAGPDLAPPSDEERAELGAGVDKTQVVSESHLAAPAETQAHRPARKSGAKVVIGNAADAGPGPTVIGAVPSRSEPRADEADDDEDAPAGTMDAPAYDDADAGEGAEAQSTRMMQAPSYDEEDDSADHAAQATRMLQAPSHDEEPLDEGMRPRGKRAGLDKKAILLGGAAAATLVLIAVVVVALTGGTPAQLAVMVSPADHAQVTLNGQAIASGVRVELEPGVYQLHVAAEGFQPHDETITVGEGANPPVAVQLEPVPKPAPPQPAEPPSAQAQAQVVQADSANADAAKADDAQTQVAQTQVAQARADAPATPELAKPQPKAAPDPEPKVVEAKHSSRSESRTQPARAEKKASKKKATGLLACSTRPAGAEVYVDNKPTGRTTPITLGNPYSLPVGKRVVHFVLNGKKSSPRMVEIDEGQVNKQLINVQLE